MRFCDVLQGFAIHGREMPPEGLSPTCGELWRCWRLDIFGELKSWLRIDLWGLSCPGGSTARKLHNLWYLALLCKDCNPPSESWTADACRRAEFRLLAQTSSRVRRPEWCPGWKLKQ